MIKELEKIKKDSANILGNYPEEHEKLVAQYMTAREDLMKAIAAKDNASDLSEFDNATEKVKEAGTRVDFVCTAIEKLEAKPRMDEADYQKAVAACEKIMSESVNKYRARTIEAMETLKQIQDEYKAEAAEVNETLMALDNAANVIQSKFVPTSYSDCWERHAKRFYPDEVKRMATSCDEEDRIDNPHYQHDSILCAAWSAVTRAFPHKSF